MKFQKFLNRLYLRILKARYKRLHCGQRVTIDTRTKIFLPKGSVTLEDNVSLRSDPKGYHAGMPFCTTLFVDIDGAFIKIGANSRVNGAYIHAQEGVSIGKNAVIAAGVNIIDSNGHEIKSLNRTTGRDKPSTICIGDNVWVGLNSIILKGTTLGNNCVVGAGSVVKGTYPENSIIVGNPATVVGTITI